MPSIEVMSPASGPHAVYASTSMQEPVVASAKSTAPLQWAGALFLPVSKAVTSSKVTVTSSVSFYFG